MVVLPSIYLLRKIHRASFLTLVCREEYGRILKEAAVVDSIISISDPKIAPLFESPPYPEELAQWLRRFSFILGWMQKKSNLTLEEYFLSLKQKRCHFFIHDPDYRGPISTFFFEKTLEFLNGEKSSTLPFSDCTLLPLSSHQKDEGVKLLGEEILKKGDEIAVVHPGSGSESKCWPLDNFFKIILKLSQRGFGGTLVTGMSETRIENRLKSTNFPAGWVWLQNPPLIKLSGLLSRAAIYLGNDSGVTHLAAACGTDVVALFRKDLESYWKPFGRVAVLSSESVYDIGLSSVWETITSILR